MSMREQTTNGVTFLAADSFLAAGGAAHGFSTRLGGVSEGIFASLNLGVNRGDDPERVRENYRRFCTAIGADANRLVFTKQVHKANIRRVKAGDAMSDPYDPNETECDALVTNVPGLALTIFTADCIPVLLYDPVRRVIAAVHAGWRSTARDITGKAVRTMQEEYACLPKNILAAIGPGIDKCCFETHEDVPNALGESLNYLVRPFIKPLKDGKFSVDLKRINAILLMNAGVAPDHIEISEDCTACLHEKYWSHRVTQGERGSMAAIIQLR